MDLYHATCQVIQDPEGYEPQGQPEHLTEEEKLFMYNLVQSEPDLFWDKIREKVFDSSGFLVFIETIQKVLQKKIGVTLKKASSINICKDLVKKFQFIKRMSSIPAKFLVFTDEWAICSMDLLRT